ncbi:lipopolysaccharide biosynthesis protein [Bacteroides sp. CG01]|uniref:lipopolysaccharide biosynthesis protein n=1 Tax=Bacteroides sp. CG01 TaxID=3096000 RepID=UPI002AFFD87F|nr:lipopolysaccharide biosynthesis protein [Bacteroides sp. CG01]
MSTQSLKNKAVKGVGWSFIDNIANSGITFLIGLVLARLLTPKEYGIMAMITIFIAISNSIIDSGFSSALIRKTDIKRVDYNTVFFFNLIIGVILYILLFLCAPIISSFFKEPILIPVTRIIGIVLIINSLGIIQRTIMVKEIDFRTQTKISLIASLSSGGIGVGMAFYGCSIWSLVGQQLSRQFLNTLFLWIYNSWRPVLEFSIDSFKNLFGFGSKLLFVSLIDTIYKNIYYIVIGRFYTPVQLGQYTRAEQFNTIFSSNLTAIVQRVSYPVLSSIQEENVRLRNAYQRIIKTTMLVTFICMLGLAAIAKPLIILLIGEKWLPAVQFLQIICFSGMLYPLHALNLNILQVKGRSDLCLKLEIIKKLILILPIIAGICWDIEYMLWSSVFISFVAYLLNSYYSSGLISYSTLSQIKDILPSFLIAFCVSGCIWSVTLLDLSNWLLLLTQLLVATVLYFVILEKLCLEEYMELRQLTLSFLRRKK